MKERFSVKGTLNGHEAILTWDDTKISGSPEAVIEFFTRQKEFAGKRFFGPMPDALLRDYHLSPLSSDHLFHEIMPDAEVIEGKDFYDDFHGLNDPPDVIR